MLGYFPAERPCVRVSWTFASTDRAYAVAQRWLSAGAARVQVQRRTEAGAAVVVDVGGTRPLIVPDDTGNRPVFAFLVTTR